MTVANAWLLKGYLVGIDAPQSILNAVDDLILSLSGNPLPELRGDQVADQPEPDTLSQAKPRKRREWSPEQRAAAADRLRARREGGLLKRKDQPEPGEAEAPPH
jgi:hypothetical protein